MFMDNRRLTIWIGLGMYTLGRIRGMCEDKGGFRGSDRCLSLGIPIMV